MITIVHLDRSRSERIIWLMEELGLEYQVELFRRGPDLYGPPELKQAHTLGRAPVIRDGDTELAESGAIVEYLLARYGDRRLAPPPSASNFPRYLYWLHYAEGSLMLQLLREWSLDRMVKDADALPGMARMRETTLTHMAMIEATLAAAPYFAGEDFTAADIMMAYPFTSFLKVRPMDLAPYPAVQAWVKRLEARPAYRAAMALG